MLPTQSLGFPVFVSEPKILVKGDFEKLDETMKAMYFVKNGRECCIERYFNVIAKCINSSKTISLDLLHQQFILYILFFSFEDDIIDQFHSELFY